MGGATSAVARMDEKEAEPAIQTILGEYVERGVNHGRKVFQKTQQPSASGARALDVLVYYWDDRDGDKYEGCRRDAQCQAPRLPRPRVEDGMQHIVSHFDRKTSTHARVLSGIV